MNASGVIGEAMARAEKGAGKEWHAYAYSFIKNILLTQEIFFVDDAWDAGLKEPRNGKRGVGPVISQLERDGLIVKTGEKKPSKGARRIWPMHIWRSMLYKK